MVDGDNDDDYDDDNDDDDGDDDGYRQYISDFLIWLFDREETNCYAFSLLILLNR